MSNQARRPKGTEAGGQFAASQNPESNVNLGGLAVSSEALHELITRANEQTETIKSLRQRVAELSRYTQSTPVVNCAYAVDEAIDVLTRSDLWDGGSGAKFDVVLLGLKEARSELLFLAESKDPDVVAKWREQEFKIRAFEGGDESMSDEEYETIRDERDALYAKIVRLNLAEQPVGVTSATFMGWDIDRASENANEWFFDEGGFEPLTSEEWGEVIDVHLSSSRNIDHASDMLSDEMHVAMEKIKEQRSANGAS